MERGFRRGRRIELVFYDCSEVMGVADDGLAMVSRLVTTIPPSRKELFVKQAVTSVVAAVRMGPACSAHHPRDRLRLEEGRSIVSRVTVVRTTATVAKWAP